MNDLSAHIYTEQNNFFFDSEVYIEDAPNKILDYEDGDMVKWTWEGKKMTGILRHKNIDLGLFSIENVTAY
jgi:hypothetical protein